MIGVISTYIKEYRETLGQTGHLGHHVEPARSSPPPSDNQIKPPAPAPKWEDRVHAAGWPDSVVDAIRAAREFHGPRVLSQHHRDWLQVLAAGPSHALADEVVAGLVLLADPIRCVDAIGAYYSTDERDRFAAQVWARRNEN